VLLFLGAVSAAGTSFRVRDVGEDIFDRGAEVVKWGDERLKAAAEGTPLPGQPELYADITSIKIGFIITFVQDVLMIAVAAMLIGRTRFRGFIDAFRMGSYSFDDLWRPALAAAVLYPAVVGYGVLMKRLGLDLLVPESTVPLVVTRDGVALAMTGVLASIAAPLAEEVLFRGVIFGGLMRWGFWPAAAISSFLFAGAHIDLGSLIPFFIIGMVLAALYWWRGVLWDNIAFHVLFNTTSFLLLVATR
jgi:membrane protease YdiL (CAAX protease family)